MEELVALEKHDIPEFAAFIKTVYDEFVARDYCEEGNATFYKYIEEKEIECRLAQGGLFFIYKGDTRIRGGIEIRNLNHISLFFVDKHFQGRGIGKNLFAYALEHIVRHDKNATYVEVNSSPYAKDIYKKLGFEQKSELLEKNGIKYYELVYSIRREER